MDPEDVFAAKYDSALDLIWIAQAGGTSTDAGFEIAASSSDQVYVTGEYQGKPGFGPTKLDPFGNTDVFVARLSESPLSCEVDWSTHFTAVMVMIKASVLTSGYWATSLLPAKRLLVIFQLSTGTIRLTTGASSMPTYQYFRGTEALSCLRIMAEI